MVAAFCTQFFLVVSVPARTTPPAALFVISCYVCATHRASGMSVFQMGPPTAGVVGATPPASALARAAHATRGSATQLAAQRCRHPPAGGGKRATRLLACINSFRRLERDGFCCCSWLHAHSITLSSSERFQAVRPTSERTRGFAAAIYHGQLSSS